MLGFDCKERRQGRTRKKKKIKRVNLFGFCSRIWEGGEVFSILMRTSLARKGGDLVVYVFEMCVVLGLTRCLPPDPCQLSAHLNKRG